MVENSDIHVYVKTRYGSDAGYLLCRRQKNVANTPLVEISTGKKFHTFQFFSFLYILASSFFSPFLTNNHWYEQNQ